MKVETPSRVSSRNAAAEETQQLLIRANARLIPLPDRSIQTIVTSPPYFGLRSYKGEQNSIWDANPYCCHRWLAKSKIVQSPQRDHAKNGGWSQTRGGEPSRAGASFISSQGAFCSECGGWKGAYGQEPTVDMYVDHSIQILRECRRVLKDDGILFWNLADSYSASGRDADGTSAGALQSKNKGSIRKAGRKLSLPAKNLCLIPERVAIAAQQDGWIVRQEIIWHKPNPMPESVKDRLTDAFEVILVLTKNAHYYWDHDAALEPAVSKPQTRRSSSKKNGRNDVARVITDTGFRNMRNVWTINVGDHKQKHVAVFPLEIPRRCIALASRPGDRILDLFCGSGTSGCAAKELGREFIGIDISEPYLEMARERIEKHECELAAPQIQSSSNDPLDVTTKIPSCHVIEMTL